MRIIFTLIFIGIVAHCATAQKILKLYRGGQQAYEYRIGDVIHFRLKEQDDFYDFMIEDLDFENQRIYIPNGFIDIKNIEAIESYRYYQGAQAASYGLYAFGSGWLFYSLIDILVEDGPKSVEQVAREGVIIGGGAFLAGFLIKRFLSTKIFELDGELYFLGIIDLNVD